MGKKQKMTKRREKLEEIAKRGTLFCRHHYEFLDLEDLYKHRCYASNHGKSSCKYVRVIER